MFISTALALVATAALAQEARTTAGPTLSHNTPGYTAEELGFDAIINGRDATRDQWPMAGGIVLDGAGSFNGFSAAVQNLMCSSTLIAPDVVLTAAHCVDIEGFKLILQIQLGGQVNVESSELYWSRRPDLSRYQLGMPQQALPEDAIKVLQAPMHPGWVGMLGVRIGLAQNNDIALMFLETPVLDVPLGYLPQAGELDLANDDPVVIVGWGQQLQDPVPGTVGKKQVAESYVAGVGDFEVKIGEIATDGRKCHGDSGGPSFKDYPESESAESWRLIGVTSHAYDMTDCRQTGGVDTRVSAYLDWIDQTMKAACADGTRSWCEIDGIIPPPLPDGTLAWEIPEDVEETKKACGCANATGGQAFGTFGLMLVLGAFSRRRSR